MKCYKVAITAGIAMFSMFFGSGNLLFPIQVGVQTNSNFGFALLGLILTGIIVPFLGLISMALYNGKREQFFNLLGKKTSFILVFAMLSLMGPFGVSARCIMVAFGGFKNIFPDLTLGVFSFFSCILIGALCWKQNKIVKIIGTYLTPWLIFSLLAIFIASILSPDQIPNSNESIKDSFNYGLFTGYQTMDLLASFFFSTAIIKFLESHIKENNSESTIVKYACASSLIGVSLLCFFYVGLIYSGAKHSPILENANPEEFILLISGHVLGSGAKFITATTIALACLTTIIILTSLFAEFLSYDIMQKKFNKKLPRHTSIIITLIITFLVSLSGFKALSFYIATVLSIFYPALIMFVIASIANKLININVIKPVFWMTCIACILFNSGLLETLST